MNRTQNAAGKLDPLRLRKRLGLEVGVALVAKVLALVLLAVACFGAAQRLHVTPDIAFSHIFSD